MKVFGADSMILSTRKLTNISNWHKLIITAACFMIKIVLKTRIFLIVHCAHTRLVAQYVVKTSKLDQIQKFGLSKKAAIV